MIVRPEFCPAVHTASRSNPMLHRSAGAVLLPGLIALLALGGCAQVPPPVAAAKPVSHPATRVTVRDREPVATVISTTAQLSLVPQSGDPLAASALIDRAVARRQREALAQPTTVNRSAHGERRSRSRRAKPGEAEAATVLAEHFPESGLAGQETACETVAARRGQRKTRKPTPSSRCQVAAQDLTGPPDLRMAQRAMGLADSWTAVRSNLVLTGVEHERLDAHLEHLRQHPGNVDFLMTRADPYLQYLLGEIKRQGLPNDLILVPMVESAFQTTALSSKQAAGLWQFIPSTGQQYGLQLTENYDGRYDTHPATQAALKYLKRLNELFHCDWLLALAAYNAGEGAVQRAVQANRLAGGTGTFWELSLPLETQNYVVKILALAKVVADPAGHGFRPHKSAPGNILARVEAKPEVPIADLIASSGMAPDEFYKLNPAFKQGVEPPAQPHHFLLPLEKAELLMAANMQGAKVYAPRKVVVKKGETLQQLAKRHGVPEPKLAEWNGLNLRAPLRAGQEIVVLGV